MIKCKKCGCEILSYTPICQGCSQELILTQREAEELLSEGKRLMSTSDYTTAVDIYKLLATLGEIEGEVEFAGILERGLLVPRDLDMAMRYFYSAAKKGNAYAAYRYSRLISRANESAGGFWLAYAAMLECADAYSDAYTYYAGRGDAETAAYYCARLAESGDTDATVEMARRHLYGTGVEQSESFAKWYIKKLSFPPLYALKLANRLHRVETAEEPPSPTFKNRDAILRSLISEARAHGLRAIVLTLSEMFAKSDAPDASVNLATLYIEGIEFEQDVERGIGLLEAAMRAGSSTGAKYLGDLYAVGKYVDRDVNRAIGYYRHAATLGSDGAFESIGDIFCDGVLTEPEVAFALSLYEKGAAEGDKSCARKAEAIRRDREKFYREGCDAEKDSPEEAFRLFKLSVGAGYMPAHAKIAPYYERGIGTKIDRHAAFKHYKLATDSGDRRVIFDLGRCYAHGIGVRFDFTLASKYLSLAREMGVEGADAELYRIYENKKRHMTRQLYSTAIRVLYNGKPETAKDLLETCMALGSTEAAYALGCLYEFGIGVAADRKAALALYKKTFAEGFRDPNQSHKQKILKMSKKAYKEELLV